MKKLRHCQPMYSSRKLLDVLSMVHVLPVQSELEQSLWCSFDKNKACQVCVHHTPCTQWTTKTWQYIF